MAPSRCSGQERERWGPGQSHGICGPPGEIPGFQKGARIGPPSVEKTWFLDGKISNKASLSPRARKSAQDSSPDSYVDGIAGDVCKLPSRNLVEERLNPMRDGGAGSYRTRRMPHPAGAIPRKERPIVFEQIPDLLSFSEPRGLFTRLVCIRSGP